MTHLWVKDQEIKKLSATMLLECGQPDGNKRESSAGVMLTVTAKRILITWELFSKRILTTIQCNLGEAFLRVHSNPNGWSGW